MELFDLHLYRWTDTEMSSVSGELLVHNGTARFEPDEIRRLFKEVESTD